MVKADEGAMNQITTCNMRRACRNKLPENYRLRATQRLSAHCFGFTPLNVTVLS